MSHLSLHYVYNVCFCFDLNVGKGDLFGTDLGFENPIIKTNCDVKSLTYCDLQCISLRGLTTVLEYYPEFAEQFRQDILHALAYNLREGYVDQEVSEGTSRVVTS